ncbi:MAG TPA: hypothetical protein DEO41_03475, partial [Betaproteobacteria bacterium]|nr:hypothetical protein [Betaproteobacteria bacterium]
LRDLSKTYNFCLKKLGIEPGEGPCFSHQLGVCMGACIEKESALNHAMRLSLALNKFLIPSWPFNGEVLLIEQSERSGLVEKHRVKNWAYLEYQVTGEKWSSEYRLLPSKEFDYDTFQILRKLIEKPTNHITIIPQI